MQRRVRKRSRYEEEEEEDDERSDKQRRGSVFCDDIADEAGSDEDEEDGDYDVDDGFLVDDPAEDDEPRSPMVACKGDNDEEEDIEALERQLKDRYNSRASEDYPDFDAQARDIEQRNLMPCVRDPKLWMVKCQPGREREVAAYLMQKSKDIGPELRIFSAIALDHLRSYIYVEAYNEAYVQEACKGMRYIFSKNIKMVPMKEMSHVLSLQAESTKTANVSKGDWVRLKRSDYKGSLAKVVGVDDVRHKVTVKLTPRLRSLSLSDKLEGVEWFYKTVALSSVASNDIQPSIEEVENFREIGEADADLATLFVGKDLGCWVRGDTVVIVKGELKNLKGSVEYVEGDIVHIKPKENIPLKTIAVRKQDVAKYFEPGCQVKVVHGVREGATGMVIQVDGNKLVILSDAAKDHITVLTAQVIETKEISGRTSVVSIGHGDRERPHGFSASRHIPHPAPPNRSLPRHHSSYSERHNSMVGKIVKIVQGPYRGYRGCVKGVNGQSIRVELEAQMKVITVDRSHISDKLPVPSPSSVSDMPQNRTGRETPLHPRTPMHSMGGETPWRTPFRTPSRPSTPVHHGSGASTYEQWNPFSFTSPSRLVPSP